MLFRSSEAQESLKDLSVAYLMLALVVKNPLPMEETEETQVWSLDRKTPRRRAWQPTPVLLPGESHAQRSLVGSTRLQIVGHDGVATLSLDHHPETTLRQ